MILGDSQAIAEALIMDDFALAKEFYRVAHVGVVAQAENVVIGRASLLLCYYHVFATKSRLAKVRKILVLQGATALFDSVCYLRLPCVKGADAEGG